jgi:hypothetical protein
MEYVFELPFGAVTVIETAVLVPAPLSGMVACPVGTPVPALTEPEITHSRRPSSPTRSCS